MQAEQLGKMQASAAASISYRSYSEHQFTVALLNAPNLAKAAPTVKISIF